MLKHLGIMFAIFALCCEAAAAPAPDSTKLRVIIIDGQNNHDWRSTTPHMKKVLEDSKRFTVDVSSNLKEGDKPGQVTNTVPFPPDLSKYDVVLSNYNGASWPMEFNRSLEEKLKEGKIGLVIVHAANNAFGGWKEYNQMIGMGWRGKSGGARLLLDEAGKEVRVPSGEGDDSGHRYSGQFQVTIRDAEHPITKGMPKEWMHAGDELYDNMRGPIENIKLLATAYSKGTKAHEPMIWTISYGKGRVFHTPMGHDLNGMRCWGFISTLNRGTEWAATGQVTLPLAKEFPTADKVSAQAPPPPPKFVSVDPDKAGPDYIVQGEYLGETAEKKKLGAEVVGRGNGAFMVNILPGGLRGEGGDYAKRVEGSAKTEGGKVTVTSNDGKWSAVITSKQMAGKTDTGEAFTLERVVRQSKTLGEKPPEGAVVLFDGKNADAWENGQIVAGHLLGSDIVSKKAFGDQKLHLEFRLSFMPMDSGQGRSNSGVYLQHRYEVQVLDSFGLKGVNNECGGLYSFADPKVNMCFPPLTWQTYDIDFKAARFDENGKKTANAVITVLHNGVAIHDKVELTKGPLPGGKDETAKPGPLHLQGHGGQVQYRNIWIVETSKTARR